jgi:hypothetical protein
MYYHLQQMPNDTSGIEEAEWLEGLKLDAGVYMWPSRGVTRPGERVPADRWYCLLPMPSPGHSVYESAN